MRDVTRIAVEESLSRGTIDFFVWIKQSDEKVAIAEPLTMKIVDEGEYYNQPTFSMPHEGMQSFMDTLWNKGYRPSQEASLGAFTAQGKHLEDMRKIAFKFLDEPK